MWIGVVDRNTGAAIVNASFSHDYANYGGGWYWVLVGQDTYLSVRAPNYSEATGYTDRYDSIKVYLAPITTEPSK